MKTPRARACANARCGRSGCAARASGANATAPSAPIPARTSPTSSWPSRPCSAPEISPSSFMPRCRRFSRRMMSRFAIAAAQHVGCALYVGPWRNIAPPDSQNGSGNPRAAHAPARDDDAAERQVAARDALREADHVRPDAEALGGEPGAEAAEGVDDRVDDEEEARAPAELGDALDVARRRLVDAAGAHDRLDEDRRDPVGADAVDLGLERLDRVVRHERGVLVERPHVGAVRGDAADARAEAVRAVVALRAADEVDALRRADRGEVAAGGGAPGGGRGA